jgi:hypothetical protein
MECINKLHYEKELVIGDWLMAICYFLHAGATNGPSIKKSPIANHK